MVSEAKDSADEYGGKLARWLLDYAIEGVPPLTAAKDLATEYLIDQSYATNDHRVRALIRWETTKNFTAGFVTGIGGLLTLPVALPAALGASWVIQGRMAGAIANIYGHDLKEDRVRTLVLLAIVGNAGKEVLKEAGVTVGKKLATVTLQNVPGRLLIDINKRVGFRLVTKAGQTGVVNLAKAVPIAGGVVGGAMDAGACRAVGWAAKRIFRPEEDANPVPPDHEEGPLHHFSQ
ncbi:MAG: EcsC family protein [Candidatus Hydrogenedentes bacterium]|nr:EcsC family protein [Candidatus Hydrogenedentota bacterium]